jgi:hypothetical protein
MSREARHELPHVGFLRDPAEWLRPSEAFRCAYVLAWTAVKRTWGLSMDQAEADAIKAVLQDCD